MHQKRWRMSYHHWPIWWLIEFEFSWRQMVSLQKHWRHPPLNRIEKTSKILHHLKYPFFCLFCLFFVKPTWSVSFSRSSSVQSGKQRKVHHAKGNISSPSGYQTLKQPPNSTLLNYMGGDFSGWNLNRNIRPSRFKNQKTNKYKTLVTSY